MSRVDTLVVRFSSLGDVVLAASVTGGLGRVGFVTHARYAALVARFPGVVQVVGAEPGEGWQALRARLPAAERVVDLHGSLRSRLVLAGRGAARLERLALARRTRVAFKLPSSLPTILDRYASTAGTPTAPRPWIRLPAGPRDALGLVPGAAHPTKVWPRERFEDLARGWPGPVLVFGSPDEAALVEGIAAAVPGAESVVERGFERTLEGLGRCRAVVAGDTGLLHLAAACGIPVVGLFGPTSSRDGFWDHPGEVVELALGCRPCSRFGGASCPIGDHRCMQALSVELVRAALARV